MSKPLKKPAAMLDLHSLSEDERIDMIGHAVTAHGKTGAVVCDDDDEKVARYISKLQARFPTVAILSQAKGPVAGTVTIRVGPGEPPAYYCMACPETFQNAEQANAHHDATGHNQTWRGVVQ